MSLFRSGKIMSKVEATLLIMVLIMSVSMISINVTAEGDDIIIESDMTWNDEMSLSQNVRVLNGGSLNLVESQLTISISIRH